MPNSMLTPDSMSESLSDAEVIFLDFGLHTRQGENALFCFFEGKLGSDNAYYVHRIKRFIDEYYPYRCGNRNNVLSVYALITGRTEYKKYKKAFFIDRDFNAPLASRIPPIFETPCYSIENFYVSVDVFKEILRNALTLSEPTDYELCINLFIERQKEYHDATILLNAWYACLIDIRNAKGIRAVSLDDKLPKNFIDFTLHSVSQKYDMDILKQTFPRATEISQTTLNEKITVFSNCEKHKVFRGKFELQFVITMIRLIIQDSENAKSVIKNKVKFVFSDTISNDQAIAIFSPYAETPDSLIDYLKEVTTNASIN